MQYKTYSGGAQEYKSSFDCAVKLVKNHGVQSLYQGFSATMVRNIPGSIIYFTAYELILQKLRSLSSQTTLPTSR